MAKSTEECRKDCEVFGDWVELEKEYSELILKNQKLQAELKDARLELCCPETINTEKEKLHKVAAIVLCAKLNIQAENERLKKEKENIIRESNDRLRIIERAGWALDMAYPSENRECIVSRIEKLKAKDKLRLANFNALLKLFNNIYDEFKQTLKEK